MGTVIDTRTGEVITTDVSQAGKPLGTDKGSKVKLLDPEYDKQTAVDEALEKSDAVEVNTEAGAGTDGNPTLKDLLAVAHQQDQNVAAEEKGKEAKVSPELKKSQAEAAKASEVKKSDLATPTVPPPGAPSLPSTGAPWSPPKPAK